MAVIEGTRSSAVGGLGMGENKVAIAVYDFAADGGTVGTITMRGDSIPSGAVIVDSLILVDTVLAGGTVTDTVQIGTEGAADIQSAAARNAAPWSTTGAKRGSMTATSAPIKTTAKRSITLTINGTALTGGKVRALVTYIEAP